MTIKQFLKKEKCKFAVMTFLVIVVAILFCCTFFIKGTSYSLVNVALNTPEKKDFTYLSDLNYITENNWSFNGWDGHEIQIDKNQDGGIINLKVNGEKRPFAKGIGLHARGQIVYDISALSTNYPRFTAKLGVDSSRADVASIWFQIFVSNDGNTWESLLKTDTLTATTDAIEVDLNVKGYKYLKIYVDPVGSNAADHGNIADAKLVTEDYVIGEDVPYDRLHKVEYYDNILGAKSLEENYNNNFNLVLERELVNKLGYWNIQLAAETVSNFEEGMEWILNNSRVLQEVIEVGEISNGSLFTKVLIDLYNANKASLNTKNGYVYEKMMIGLAAAYSTDTVISPLVFSFQSPTTYDYLERFTIMKELFDNNQLRRFSTNVMNGAAFEPNEWFKDYHVQLMRMVMQDGTSNIDLKWLNGFTNEKQSVSFYMIGYVSPTYTLDKYYAEENKETYDKQYYLSKYKVPYGLTNGTKVSRYWMVFANGGLCWNASRAGQSMYRVNGIPATGAYQVGHELYIQYYQNNNGDGYWSTRYGNWSGAGSTWGGSNPYRYIFNWNNKYFADRHISGSKIATSTGYLYLGQANLNNLEKYQKSLYYNLIANSYSNNNQKLDTYFKSLEVNDINLDTYDNIINIYKAMSVKNEGGTITSTDWYNLALKIVDSYKFHPVAMFDLLKVIRPYLEGSEKLHIDRLEKETLTRATRTNDNESIQAEAVRVHANNLLNKAQPDPMTFSFDGAKAGIIVKNPIYQLAWGYSLDGGTTWAKFNNNGTETEFTDADEIALTPEEIASITSENDIKFKFMGLADFKFTIDITNGSLSDLLYPNDLENRVVGIDLTYEWRNSESDPWTSYKTASPDNTGDKTLYVRRGNTGTQLASNSATYTFTADNQPNTRKYVAVSHLSIAGVSTEATNNAGAAIYSIDGNYNTRWHSAWDGTDTKRYIIIKLDKLRYISAVEFVPAGGGNGRINDGTIYGSVDGENWEVLAQRTGITYNTQANSNEQAKAMTQSFDIPEDKRKEIQYIKIVADRTNGNWFTARAFNIFQDLTLSESERPTAGIGYSTTEPTTENVIARLVNPSTNITITNNGGSDTYIFTEEGNHEFTFEFVDENGIKGTSTARVDWIDRTAPTATIEYSTKNPINSSVFATLKPSEDIKVTNNGYYSINEDGEIFDKDGNLLSEYTADENGIVKDSSGKVIDPLKYEFLDNGEFTFEFVDRAGNIGTATAKVDWIDFDKPEATLEYSKTTLTNEDVTVTIDFDEEATVTNNNGDRVYTFKDNGEFIFEFADKAGNRGTITAKVDWIDKVAPTAELKYERKDDKVIVTVINSSEEITYKEGIGVYEFTKNGNYEIIFYDKVGNEGKLIANITGLKDDSSSGDNQPSEPTNPVNPDDNKPSEPDNKPGDNNPEGNKPNENPGNNNNENNQPGNNTGEDNNTSNPGTETNQPTEPINKEYKEYSTPNIKVQIPIGELNNSELILKSAPFALTSSLLGTFGEVSEYYDIYLQNPAQNRVDMKTESSMKVSIKINKSKKLIGVYEITEDNNIKVVDYERNGDNIELVVNNLGRYVISYKEIDLPTVNIPVFTSTSNDINLTIIGVLAVAIVGLVLYIAKLNKELSK